MEKVVSAQESRKEEQKIGSVGFDVYKSYFKSVESTLTVITVFCLVVIGQFAISYTDFFVTSWYAKTSCFFFMHISSNIYFNLFVLYT